ncbi:DUF3102 domain-containing protein [Leptospira bouyouniensis]|uniref:DUF3102 domain-containing protein n=1 Tax=Leptospira bouyouniensis TaxID=2484911 RepID=A0ABY2L3E6_9LEPT|nr:DUF3102 domain-containing protein [Leptospira bouyouniensis]TGK45532.1 DUF3102 domain-containing protein [Leptospira bouyouniensis]
MSTRSKLISNVVGTRPGHAASLSNSIKKNEVSEINLLHQSIVQDLSNAVQSAILIGEKLQEQKKLVGHGKWEQWMKENLEFSDSTAKRYIRLSENKQLVNRSSMTDLNSALKLISETKRDEKDITPAETPILIYKRYRAQEKLSTRERSILKEYLKGEKEKILLKTQKKISAIDSDIANL